MTTQRTFQSSDLSRNPGAVFSAAEDNPVLLTRRDGDSLVLMNESEMSQQVWLCEFAARLVTAMSDDRGSLTERMCAQFSWMLAFDESGRENCAQELIDAARTGLSTGVARKAHIVFTSWFESAAALTTGLDKIPVKWLSDTVSVPRPN